MRNDLTFVITSPNTLNKSTSYTPLVFIIRYKNKPSQCTS